MKISRSLACFIWLAAGSLRVFAWGNDGHETVGAIAEALITNTPAAAHVRELLGDESLSTAAIWADVIRSPVNQTPEMLQFKAANPGHTVFHYTDIPFEESAYSDTSVGATNVDVVHAIPACILILQGKPGEQHILSNTTPRIALRLLAHYVGDLHQPLHVGSGYLDGTNYVDPNGRAGKVSEDRGGNQLIFGGTNKLHWYWDTTVVKNAMQAAHVQTPAEFAKYLLAKSPPPWKSDLPLLQWDRAWAAECLPLAAKLHELAILDEDDSQTDFRTGAPRPVWHVKEPSPEYTAWAQKTAEEQLTKAGVRLAAVLQAIWPSQ